MLKDDMLLGQGLGLRSCKDRKQKAEQKSDGKNKRESLPGNPPY
jgi:hypothetical protein